MKTVIFVTAALLLCGCETGDGWVPGENPGTEPAAFQRPAPVAARAAPAVVASAPLAPPAPVYPAPPVVAAAPVVAPPPVAAVAPVVAPQPVASSVVEMTAAAAPSPYDEHCKAVAHLRAADARANGYSFEMADTVYDGAFKDCVIWDSQHGPGVSR